MTTGFSSVPPFSEPDGRTTTTSPTSGSTATVISAPGMSRRPAITRSAMTAAACCRDGGSDIRASFGALELSRDFDWVRIRASALYASGDDNPFDNEANGFDAVLENPLIARRRHELLDPSIHPVHRWKRHGAFNPQRRPRVASHFARARSIELHESRTASIRDRRGLRREAAVAPSGERQLSRIRQSLFARRVAQPAAHQHEDRSRRIGRRAVPAAVQPEHRGERISGGIACRARACASCMGTRPTAHNTRCSST